MTNFTTGNIIENIRQSLSRITSSGRFIPEIDGLRFIAIMSVLFYHVGAQIAHQSAPAVVAAAESDPLCTFIHIGDFGVELFFVISGFILALPFAEHYLTGSPAVKLRNYYLRRLTRLEPPYFVALIIYTILLAATGKVALPVLLPHFAASIFYLHNMIYQAPSLVLFVAWSLEIEVQFYILAPLLSKLFLVKTPALRRLLTVTAIIFFSMQMVHLGLNLSMYLQYFLIGFLLADFYTVTWKTAARKPYLWDITGALGWLTLVVILLKDWHVNVIAPPVVFMAFAGVLRGRLWNWLLTLPWITTIGGMCYTIYLYHPALKSGITRLTLKYTCTDLYWVNALLQFCIIIPIIIAISAVLFMLFERPFMRRDWTSRTARWLRKVSGGNPGSS